jgi:hypothetical protein
MLSQHMIKFELKDIITAFDKLNEIRSSGDNLENLSKSPPHILLYNEILKFSKEELESPIPIRNRTGFIYNYISNQQHAMFFKACILTGAFKDKLYDESNWLLDNIPNPSNQLYETIHYLERGKKTDNNSNKLTFSAFMDVLIGRYFYIFDTEEKKEVMDLILKKYIKKQSNFLQNLVVDRMPQYESHSGVHEYIGNRLNALGLITININDYLPKPKDYPDHNNDFKFGSQHLSKIERLLKCGFRFDEKEYCYYGDNLFIALVKSKQLKLCEIILPYLSDVTPKSGSYAEQHAYIDSLNQVYPKDYKLIQSHYERLVLNLELEKKAENEKIRKPKI